MEVSEGFVNTPGFEGKCLVLSYRLDDIPPTAPEDICHWRETVRLAKSVGLVKATNDDDDANWLFPNRTLITAPAR
jgi:hypothetical protein